MAKISSYVQATYFYNLYWHNHCEPSSASTHAEGSEIGPLPPEDTAGAHAVLSRI